MHCGLSRLTNPWIVPNAKSKIMLLFLKRSVGDLKQHQQETRKSNQIKIVERSIRQFFILLPKTISQATHMHIKNCGELLCLHI